MYIYIGSLTLCTVVLTHVYFIFVLIPLNVNNVNEPYYFH